MLVVLAASILATVTADSADLAHWHKGPARYLITKEEARRSRALETDRDRALFVERFWLRRDPDPDTLGNEYRQVFWQRVQDANEMFLDSPRPGWMTDRGKIYILYGPPSDIQDMPNLTPESTPTSSAGVIRWIYEGRPGGRQDLDPVTVVPFVRDIGGEYRLSHDPKLASVFFDELGIREGKYKQYSELLSAYPSELSVMLDLGKLQEVPPQEQIVIERVEMIETYRTYPLSTQVDRSLDPETGAPLISVTLHLPDVQPASRPALMARFTSRDATDSPVLLGEGSFVARDDGGAGMVAQARTTLTPATYDLLVVAATPRSDKTGLSRQVVVVPPPRDGLQLSDVIAVAELQPVVVSALASHTEPFYLGAFEAVPRCGRPIHPGDAIRLVYEIYGGTVPFRVTYSLEGKETDGSWVPLGRPAVLDDAQAAQGWELPTSEGWPVGAYRIRILVADSAGATADAVLPFELQPREAGTETVRSPTGPEVEEPESGS